MNKTRLYTTIFLSAMLLCSKAQITPISQMEKLDRGLVALPASSGSGNFVSWRFLGTDDSNTRFDLVCNGTTIAADLEVSNYKDANGDSSSEYQVITKVNGEVVNTSDAVKAWDKVYKTLKLDLPAKGAQGGTYSPNDCSVGDIDGDGEYEIFVKWDPSNSQDNSNGGKTDNVFIDCYKLDGTKLWRIDLGVNIRAGAHYTQFQVYDYDGDGKAELMCKTAPGSKDGKGNYVNQVATDEKIKAANNTKDHRTSAGRINSGHEYLTVFNGETGEAIHTIAYYPNRNAKAELSEAAGSFNWDDRSGKNDKGDYGNRGERYLAATAYLDGPDHNPSGIFCRGYYTFAYIWAVDFDGQQLKTRWLHGSDSRTTYKWMTPDENNPQSLTSKTLKGNTCYSGLNRYTMYANGNHNMSIADVDGDGKDEIIWGSAALDDNGKMLYSVGFGHGDAIHLADLDPDRPGLELFDVHEEKGTYAWDIHDAATGEILFKGGPKGADNGRGLAADIVASNRGYEFWSSYGGPENASDRNQNPFSAQTGKQVIGQKASMNFRIYWDGDLQDELFDGTNISHWNGSGYTTTALGNYNASQSCNGTKATPNLLADLFGDWREEVILWSANDNATLNIFTTNTPTTYRVPTLMHDHTYRMGICWQNTAYNQPPHLGYYLPDYIDGKITGIRSLESGDSRDNTIDWTRSDLQIFDLQGRKIPTDSRLLTPESLPSGLYIIKQGTKVIKFNKQ
jgi:rhamnogalacturonan endolyase